MGEIHLDLFVDCLGNRFQIHASPEHILSVELIEATPLQSVAGEEQPGRRAGFSLLFRAALDQRWEQGIYNVIHAQLGVIPMFLVPIGPDGQGERYEAIFN